MDIVCVPTLCNFVDMGRKEIFLIEIFEPEMAFE